MWLIVLAGMCLFSTSASAYLDPGSGSLILQLIVGGIATLLGTFRFWGSKLFKKAKKDGSDAKGKKDSNRAA